MWYFETNFALLLFQNKEKSNVLLPAHAYCFEWCLLDLWLELLWLELLWLELLWLELLCQPGMGATCLRVGDGGAAFSVHRGSSTGTIPPFIGPAVPSSAAHNTFPLLMYVRASVTFFSNSIFSVGLMPNNFI